MAAALLTWLVHSGRLDLDVFLEVRSGAQTWAHLALGAVAVAVGLTMLSLRLYWLLDTVGHKVRFRTTMRITLLGSFSGTLLPGLVGGDVVKAAALCKGLPDRKRVAVGAVMADRIVGVYSLFTLAALGILTGWATGRLPHLPPALLALPILVVVGGPVALLLSRVARHRLSAFVPARLTEQVEPLLASLRVLFESPRVLAGVTLLGIVNHALVVITFVVAGNLLAAPLRLLDHWILDPLALTFNAVPFSPGGLGLAEGAFSFLYEFVGVSQGAAVGVLGRAIQYVVFVATGLIALIMPDDAPATEDNR